MPFPDFSARLPAGAPLWALLLAGAAVASSGACIEDVDYGDGGGGAGVGGGAGAGPPPDPIPFTVATWNTRNLFNDQNDSPEPQEEIDPGWPQRRMEVAKVLTTLDADVVVLQEVENFAVLDDINKFELDSGYEHITVSDGNDPRSIDIGVMSRYPFDQVISHADEGFVQTGTTGPSYRFARDAYEIHMTVNQRHVVLIGVHFKAKDNDDPDKRLAEAQRTRQIANAIAAEDPNAAIVVLGDFNDTPQSPPYTAVVGGDPTYMNTPLSAPAPQYTFEFGGQQELVDHMMVNPLMAERLDPSSVLILHSADVDDASDHAPIRAQFSLN